MRVLSLFSGGGLGDFGLELAGMKIVGQVENNDYCQKSSNSDGRESQNGGISDASMGKKPLNNGGQLTLFPADSLASLSVLPGSDAARRMTVISGQKCFALYPRSGQLGFLLKMFLASSDLWSPWYSLTWKAKGMKRFRRLFFQLMPLVPRICDNESGLLPTPQATEGGYQRSKSARVRIRPGLAMTAKLLPTPRAIYGEHPGMKDPHHLTGAAQIWPTPRVTANGGHGRHRGNNRARLEDEVHNPTRMLPTPTARDFRTGDKPESRRARNVTQYHTPQLNDVVAPGGQLNPTWVEWLMGCPIGWTDLNCSATAKSFRLSNGSGKKS